MRVLLLNPKSPYLENDAAYPPMGLMYITSVLKSLGHDTYLIDLTTVDETYIEKQLYWMALDFDLIGITCVTPNVPIVNHVLQHLPQDIPIMIGGAHPTFVPMQIFRHPNYFIVKGECEVILSQIIDDAENKCIKPSYQQDSVSPICNILSPDRTSVDLHKYTPGGEITTPIYTSRGCPFHCNFCSKITSDSYRILPDIQVINEINQCIDLGFNNIVIGDDNFIINIERSKRLLHKIKDLDITLRLNQDSRVVRDDVFSLAANAGCTSISFGIESGSQSILNNMNKQTTVEKNLAAIKMAHDYGMDVKIYLVSNFPGENNKTINDTIDFVRIAEPEKWMISNFSPLPGSDVYNHKSKYGVEWISNNWSDYYLVGKNASFIPSFTTKELTRARQIELHDKLYNGLIELKIS